MIVSSRVPIRRPVLRYHGGNTGFLLKQQGKYIVDKYRLMRYCTSMSNKHEKRIMKSITLKPEMYEYIEHEATINHRPFSWQVSLMLEIAREFEDLQSQHVDKDTERHMY